MLGLLLGTCVIYFAYLVRAKYKYIRDTAKSAQIYIKIFSFVILAQAVSYGVFMLLAIKNYRLYQWQVIALLFFAQRIAYYTFLFKLKLSEIALEMIELNSDPELIVKRITQLNRTVKITIIVIGTVVLIFFTTQIIVIVYQDVGLPPTIAISVIIVNLAWTCLSFVTQIYLNLYFYRMGLRFTGYLMDGVPKSKIVATKLLLTICTLLIVVPYVLGLLRWILSSLAYLGIIQLDFDAYQVFLGVNFYLF